MKTWSVKRSRRGVLHYQEHSSRDWSAPLTLFRPWTRRELGKWLKPGNGHSLSVDWNQEFPVPQTFFFNGKPGCPGANVYTTVITSWWKANQATAWRKQWVCMAMDRFKVCSRKKAKRDSGHLGSWLRSVETIFVLRVISCLVGVSRRGPCSFIFTVSFFSFFY